MVLIDSVCNCSVEEYTNVLNLHRLRGVMESIQSMVEVSSFQKGLIPYHILCFVLCIIYYEDLSLIRIV